MAVEIAFEAHAERREGGAWAQTGGHRRGGCEAAGRWAAPTDAFPRGLEPHGATAALAEASGSCLLPGTEWPASGGAGVLGSSADWEAEDSGAGNGRVGGPRVTSWAHGLRVTAQATSTRSLTVLRSSVMGRNGRQYCAETGVRPGTIPGPQREAAALPRPAVPSPRP